MSKLSRMKFIQCWNEEMLLFKRGNIWNWNEYHMSMCLCVRLVIWAFSSHNLMLSLSFNTQRLSGCLSSSLHKCMLIHVLKICNDSFLIWCAPEKNADKSGWYLLVHHTHLISNKMSGNTINFPLLSHSTIAFEMIKSRWWHWQSIGHDFVYMWLLSKLSFMPCTFGAKVSGQVNVSHAKN